MDYTPVSNLVESAKAELTGLFPSLKCLQEGAASPIRPGLPPLHVGDRTHTTVQTEGHRQHLSVMHQYGGASTLGLRLSVSTYTLGSWFGHILRSQGNGVVTLVGKLFQPRAPRAIVGPQIKDITLWCT